MELLKELRYNTLVAPGPPHETTRLHTLEIPVLEMGLVDLDPVHVQHTGNAVFAIDAIGRRWVRKPEGGFQETLAEMIGWVLGITLGARIPNAALHIGARERSWLSEVVTNATHWTKTSASQLENPGELGATLALDALILNADRHAANLLMQSGNSAARCVVWAIDHGDATVGYPSDFRERVDEVPAAQNHARGLPLDLLEKPAMIAAIKATQIPPQDILCVTRLACSLVGELQWEFLAETLAIRCAHAPALVSRYLSELRRLSP